MIYHKQKGFTLLEILLVIAAIGILAAIVLVAINPNRQLAQARDTVRQSDINTIYKALEQYLLATGSYPSSVSTTPGYICNTGSEQVGGATNCSGRVDLRELVPTYIAAIPRDTQATGTSSGYNVFINTNNRVAVSADLAERKVIAINITPIITNGLVLHLDAGNTASYPGSGNTWFDLSGGGRNYAIGSNISWNFAGYFNVTGGTFTGPASNTFSFNTANEHYIEVILQVTSATDNAFFRWDATPSIGADTRGILTHLPFSGVIYYDVGGCCTLSQRIQYAYDSDLGAGIRHVAWRTRTSQTPNRQIFKNTISQLDSGANSTGTVTWNLTAPATIGGGFQGRLYNIKVYNRALSDAEREQNFNAMRGRYGL